MIEGFYDQSELKGIISLCDFFIGSRMHSCIAALSQGIPTVGIAYSKKFIGVFESAGVGEFVIDARLCDKRDALETLLKRYKTRNQIAPVLKATSATLKRTVQDIVGQSFNSAGYATKQHAGK